MAVAPAPADGECPGRTPEGEHQAGPGNLPGAATDSRRPRGEESEGCKAPAGSAPTGAAGPKGYPELPPTSLPLRSLMARPGTAEARCRCKLLPFKPDAAGPARTRGRQHGSSLPPARGYGAATRVRDVNPAGAAVPSRPCRRHRRRRTHRTRRHGEASPAIDVRSTNAAGSLTRAAGSTVGDHIRHDDTAPQLPQKR